MQKPKSIKLAAFLNVLSLYFLILFLYLLLFFTAGWLNSFSIYKQQKVIGELYVSQKYTKNDKPAFSFVYTPSNDNYSAFWTIMHTGMKSYSEPVRGEVYGDKLYIHTSFVDLADYGQTFGVDKMYKIESLQSSFYNPDNNRQFGVDTIQVIPGSDQITGLLIDNSSRYDYLVDDAFRYTYGVDALTIPQTYKIVVKENSIALRN